ncbi:MAG: M1 family metallopeptidase [Chitinophagales bacterium]
MKFKFRSIVIATFFTVHLSAQEPTCYHYDQGTTREKNIKPYDLVLEVRLKEKEGKVEGKANYKFVNLRKEIDSFFFDAIKFNVNSIIINKESVKFRTDSAGITVFLPKSRPDTNSMVIDYSCHPLRGMYFLNWNNPNTKAYRQIWTQGQGIDNRHYIPGIDDVANLLRMTTKVTFNDQYPVVSNGNLVSTVQNADKTKTWTYKLDHPHALYLTMIAAGDYKFKNQKSKGGITLEQYYYHDKPEYFEPTYQHSEVMMDWFEDEIKVRYPWGKIYRNVPTQDFLYGAMENTSSTIFADYMHQDWRGQQERGYLAVNAHELAHQWFGDLITERSGPHHWLHESFASHYSKKFLQYLKGDDMFDWIRKGDLEASFNAGKSNSLPVAHTAAGSSRHYPKGSFVLDMLRNELGNDHYIKSIAYYLKRFYHKNVETSDLVASIYEATGRNVKWFFDQWVRRGGEPVISFNYTIQGKNLIATTKQIQNLDATVGNFRLPMTLSIYYKNGTGQHTKTELKNTNDTFIIPLNQNAVVTFVLLDENMEFLRKVSYDYDTKVLLEIAENSNKTFGRLEAIEKLRATAWTEKNKTFLNVYHKEKSALIRNEIIEQVAKSDSDEIAKDLLIHGFTDQHVQVRRNTIKSVHFKDETLKSLLIDRLKDSSYVNVEYAVIKLIELYPNEKTLWLKSIEGQNGIMNNLNYLYHSTIFGDSSMKEQHAASLDKLKFLASESNEFRSRVPAITFLMEKEVMDLDIAKSLIQGALYFHPSIKGNSIEYLKKIKEKQPQIFEQAIKEYPFAEPNHTLDKLNILLSK